MGLHLFCRGDLDRGNRAAELQNVWLKRTALRDGALPVIIIFTSNHIATLQTTTQMKIIQTFTTLAVLAIAFSAAEGRVLRGAAAAIFLLDHVRKPYPKDTVSSSVSSKSCRQHKHHPGHTPYSEHIRYQAITAPQLTNQHSDYLSFYILVSTVLELRVGKSRKSESNR